jgi:hypothetical protein
MKITVAVIVYDRFDNVREWIRCFKMSNNLNAELIIIHNIKTEEDVEICKNICLKDNIKYVPRGNIGYDIGALQDVCKQRLLGFPNQWDYLFWITDDVIPMWKNFIVGFQQEVQKPGIGVACLEISTEVKRHIRTSGFIISKEVALKLVFPADPVLTKRHCYDFEHRSTNTFLNQIERMNKKAIQVSPTLPVSHLWDTGHRVKLNRWNDHYKEFPKSAVLFICPIYNSYPQIISSLICQTDPNWELLLIHDGKNTTNLKKIITDVNDSRINYNETVVRYNDWGHTLRKNALNDIKSGMIRTSCAYIVITNSDNYYVPVFIEEMLKGFVFPGVVATYCSHFIHGYKSPQIEGNYRFGVMQTKLELGHIDCGGVMVRRTQACDVGWRDLSIYSDWTYFSDIIKKYGIDKWNKVLGCLFSHN